MCTLHLNAPNTFFSLCDGCTSHCQSCPILWDGDDDEEFFDIPKPDLGHTAIQPFHPSQMYVDDDEELDDFERQFAEMEAIYAVRSSWDPKEDLLRSWPVGTVRHNPESIDGMGSIDASTRTAPGRHVVPYFKEAFTPHGSFFFVACWLEMVDLGCNAYTLIDLNFGFGG